MDTSPPLRSALPHPVVRRKTRKRPWITLLAVLVLAGAWLYGHFTTQGDSLSSARNVLPGADRIEPKGEVLVGYGADGTLVGYAGAVSAPGYGGPLTVLVGIHPDGKIIGVQVLSHKETPGFFRALARERFYQQFIGANAADPLIVGKDIDGISGATLSVEGVARSIRESAHRIAQTELGKSVPAEALTIQFGVPEATLVALFVVAFFAHRTRYKKTQRWVRWVTLLTGMIVIGFVYNKPFTLSNVTSFLAGFWPDWRTNLYWFLLLGGILFVTSVHGKNPYCSWFCPFGAVQHTLGTLTGAKLFRPRRLHNLLTWLQRGLAFGAIALGLAFRQPGAISYEPFGTLFDLTGSWPQWVLLALILLGSMVVYRPFCNYLCPLDPVVGYIGEVRRWIRDIWKQLQNR